MESSIPPQEGGNFHLLRSQFAVATGKVTSEIVRNLKDQGYWSHPQPQWMTPVSLSLYTNIIKNQCELPPSAYSRVEDQQDD